MNKKKFLLLATITLLIFAVNTLTGLAAEAFEINNYNIDVQVFEDNSYTITETIQVDFNEQRHGIYRTIPVSYNGKRIVVKDISVKNYEYSVSSSFEEVQIKIGDPDIYVSGQQTYQISYRYIIGTDSYADYDELYLNLIGPEWDTYIHSADFTIEMPKEFDSQRLNFTTGGFGSTSNNNVGFTVVGNVISGHIINKLRAYEGLTVALPLPEGYFAGAKDNDRFLELTRWITYIIAALLVIVAYTQWSRYGRDKKLFAPVEFYPPPGMTSAEMGYIVDGVVDNRDVTSLIIYWASRGYLKIVEPEESDSFLGRLSQKLSKNKFTLVKLCEADSSMRDYEREMFNSLFEYGDGETVSAAELHNQFFSTVNSTRSSIRRYFDNAERRLYTKKSMQLRVLTHLLAIVPCFAILLVLFNNILRSLGSAAILAFIVSLMVDLPIAFLLGVFMTKNTIKPGIKIVPILGLIVAAVPALLFGTIFLNAPNFRISDILVLLITCITINFIAFVMPKRTEYGHDNAEKILGFREFLMKAEKPRLEALVEENPEYFYDTLAFALVLGVSDKWSEKFDSIAIEPPNWYQGYHYGHFSAMNFSRHLNNSFETMHKSMVSAPSSRGSGGSSSMSGGSVGGGAGGGGGGSW